MGTEPDPKKRVRNVEIAVLVGLISVLFLLVLEPIIHMFTKARENVIRANLGQLRSALASYYSDTQQYPRDDLTCLTTDGKYLSSIPRFKSNLSHKSSNRVLTEDKPHDSGQWSYNNDAGSPSWGSLHVACLHPDSTGVVWSSY